MSRPIVPEFVSFGFLASAETNVPCGGDGGHGGVTKISVSMDLCQMGLSVEMNVRENTEKEISFEIEAQGDWEGEALVGVFCAIADKLRADMEEKRNH